MKRFVIIAALSTSLFFGSIVSTFAEGEWWRDGFNYVYYHDPKIMSLDQPDNVFHPYRDVTRREVADALWRFDNEASVEGSKFWDVDKTDSGVQYVSGTGIMNGVDDKHFDPEGLITREQMATIAYRFAKKLGCDVTIPTKVDKDFKDYNQISDYAWGAVVWAVNAGIMTGTDEGFEPKANLNRGQIATIIKRLAELDRKTNNRQEADENSPVGRVSDKETFVENLAWLLRQTNAGLVEIDYHDSEGKEYLTLHYQDSDERVNIQNCSYAEIILKVVEAVLL